MLPLWNKEIEKEMDKRESFLLSLGEQQLIHKFLLLAFSLSGNVNVPKIHSYHQSMNILKSSNSFYVPTWDRCLYGFT